MATATVRLAPSQPPQDLDAVLAEVDRHLGPGVAATLDDGPSPVAAIPTGSLALDLALGVGGIPKGRITEIYGPEGAGKTTLALSVIAQAQQHGASACYIDTEHALDHQWAATTGVELSRLVLCQPEHGEQALQVTSLLIGSGAVEVLVIDSIAALVPRAELAAEIGEREDVPFAVGFGWGLHDGSYGQASTVAGRSSGPGSSVVARSSARASWGSSR